MLRNVAGKNGAEQTWASLYSTWVMQGTLVFPSISCSCHEAIAGASNALSLFDLEDGGNARVAQEAVLPDVNGRAMSQGRVSKVTGVEHMIQGTGEGNPQPLCTRRSAPLQRQPACCHVSCTRVHLCCPCSAVFFFEA